MKPVTLLSGTDGINTVVDPVRVPYNKETGISDLAVGINIKIDPTGRISRRVGITQHHAGALHSLFCDGGECLVSSASELFVVGSGFGLTAIRTGMTGNRLSYTHVGPDIFYANGAENGYIRSSISYSWPVQEYRRRETNRQFSEVPVGNHIVWAFNRMWIAVDNVLWYTEPGYPGMLDKANCYFSFHSRLRMVKPVAAGFFISDENDTWFYPITNPQKPGLPVRVAAYPATEWSDSIDYVEGKEIGKEPGLCALWASPEGACLGTASGSFENLNKDKVIYPEQCQSGAGLLRGYSFIHTIS